MGLDIVELVIRTEEVFNITIDDSDAEKIRTVGDLYEQVWAGGPYIKSNRYIGCPIHDAVSPGGWPTHQIEPIHRVPHSCRRHDWVIRAKHEPAGTHTLPRKTSSSASARPAQ